jgi:hypothetical protein
MKKLASVLVLLSLAGVGRADDAAIIERLEAEGVIVLPVSSGLVVGLDASNFDIVLPELCELRGLRSVNLQHPELTDHQLQQVCALPGVKFLHFDDCPITNVRLKTVVRVRGLETLGLDGAAITDDGLAELTGLRDLKALSLKRDSVTDAGLRHLEGMRGLTWLDLRACHMVTDAGVARLQKALPKCHIER